MRAAWPRDSGESLTVTPPLEPKTTSSQTMASSPIAAGHRPSFSG